MNKNKLTDYLQSGFQSEIKDATMLDLKNRIRKFREESETETLGEFMSELEPKFPEIQVLHAYFIRAKLKNIESHLNTIKIILVFFFITAILAGLLAVLSSI